MGKNKVAKKSSDGSNAMSSGATEESDKPDDPVTVLEKHGCSVFMPDQR
jgi:hypothetical protein